VRKRIELVNQTDKAKGGTGALAFHTVSPEDPAVYDMLCTAARPAAGRVRDFH
jgi:hypothetical protein